LELIPAVRFIPDKNREMPLPSGLKTEKIEKIPVIIYQYRINVNPLGSDFCMTYICKN
jgi:hypothetical protein